MVRSVMGYGLIYCLEHRHSDVFPKYYSCLFLNQSQQMFVLFFKIFCIGNFIPSRGNMFHFLITLTACYLNQLSVFRV